MAPRHMGIGDFIFVVSFLLGLLIVLVVWLSPFVGIGLAVYYVFRGRVSRWGHIALVIGIPLALIFAFALGVGVMVFFVNAISE